MRKEWRWLRENKDGWKLTDSGLKVLIEPGNMWGKAKQCKECPASLAAGCMAGFRGNQRSDGAAPEETLGTDEPGLVLQ